MPAGATRVTLGDVAAASGVSRSTVSFVLNDAPGQTISAPTRERVRRAARELGYVPHGIARALREGTSRIVVLNADSSQDGNYARSFIKGLDEELAAHDHVLLVRPGTASPQSDRQVLDAIAPRAVLHFRGAYQRGDDLGDMGGGWKGGLAAHTALQIGYLAQGGHTDIAMALPEEQTPFGEVRLRFAQEIVQSLDLPPLTPVIVPQRRAAGTRAIAALRADHPAVTAIAALDDAIGARTLTALHDLGLTAPDDLAVIGYDDAAYGELTTPALTTVRIDADAHGRLAARNALGLDASDLTPTPGHVIVRQSA